MVQQVPQRPVRPEQPPRPPGQPGGTQGRTEASGRKTSRLQRRKRHREGREEQAGRHIPAPGSGPVRGQRTGLGLARQRPPSGTRADPDELVERLGAAPAYIGYIEDRATTPGIGILLRLADALETRVGEPDRGHGRPASRPEQRLGNPSCWNSTRQMLRAAVDTRRGQSRRLHVRRAFRRAGQLLVNERRSPCERLREPSRRWRWHRASPSTSTTSTKPSARSGECSSWAATAPSPAMTKRGGWRRLHALAPGPWPLAPVDDRIIEVASMPTNASSGQFVAGALRCRSSGPSARTAGPIQIQQTRPGGLEPTPDHLGDAAGERLSQPRILLAQRAHRSRVEFQCTHRTLCLGAELPGVRRDQPRPAEQFAATDGVDGGRSEAAEQRARRG